MKERAPGVKKIARVLLPAAALAFILSLFLRDRLPAKGLILEPLLQEPIQSADGVPEPFEVTRKNVEYTVTPLFSYELWGLIVSSHDASSFIDVSHKAWNDFLNTKDICVIWGRNVESGVYRRMRFRNRDFTCYYRYPDEAAAELFSESCLSNNHLLPDGPLVAEAIRTARKGDQVRLKGWLASYGIKGAPYQRKSSLVRTDRGNGACEVVYVTEFEILSGANAPWRALHKLSLAVIGLSLIALIFL
jgi:hypothetical protein